MKENYGKTNSSVYWVQKAPTGLNIELKHCRCKIYEAFADLTA